MTHLFCHIITIIISVYLHGRKCLPPAVGLSGSCFGGKDNSGYFERPQNCCDRNCGYELRLVRRRACSRIHKYGVVLACCTTVKNKRRTVVRLFFITSERSADGIDFVFSECALLSEGAEFKQAFATVSARVFSCWAYFGADFRIFF